jgi:hypothetical protein
MIGLLARAIAAAKGLKAGAAVSKAVGGARFAGTKLAEKLGPNFAKAFPKEINGVPLPGRGIVGSVLPDVAFGVMSGMSQPGDFGDKLIAGTTDAMLGAGLTGGTRGLLGLRPGTAASNAVEMGLGMGAGMASYPVSEALLRIKGGGQSPYDKLQTEQYAAMQQQVKDDLYAQMMAGNRTPYIQDPFLSANGLG